MTPSLLALSLPGGPELIFIFFLVLLLFGAKKLPELARGLGRSLGEFKKAREEFEREVHRSSAEVETTTVKPAGAISTTGVSAEAPEAAKPSELPRA